MDLGNAPMKNASLPTRIIAVPSPDSQLRVSNQLNGDGTPRTIARGIRRTIADTVNHAQVVHDARVDTFQIFHFPRLINLIAAFRSQYRELLPRHRVSALWRAVQVSLFLGIQI